MSHAGRHANLAEGGNLHLTAHFSGTPLLNVALVLSEPQFSGDNGQQRAGVVYGKIQDKQFLTPSYSQPDFTLLSSEHSSS